MDTLVKEGVLSKTGKDTYTRYKKKVCLFFPSLFVRIQPILNTDEDPTSAVWLWVHYGKRRIGWSDTLEGWQSSASWWAYLHEGENFSLIFSVVDKRIFTLFFTKLEHSLNDYRISIWCHWGWEYHAHCDVYRIVMVVRIRSPFKKIAWDR